MTASLIALLAALRSSLRSRLELETEVLALRHQLAVLQRQGLRRPRFRQLDRLLWVLWSRLWPNWRRAVHIVTPETVVRWHRRGCALAWSWKSRRRQPGRPAVAADLRALIRQMQAANPLWGAPRIPGELQTLGSEIAQTTVAQVPSLPGNAALTDLAGLPDQSRGPARLDRLLHRPDGDLPGVVCLRRCWRTTDGALAT
jgi:hypothetical protein